MRKWWIFAAISVVVTGLAAVVVWGTLAGKPSDWWSAWGQWVGGVGTAGATLIAVFVLLVQQQDKHRAAAESVSGWVEIEVGSITRVVIGNAATTPVFDVIARVVFNGQTCAVESPDSVPPGGREIDLRSPVQIWACTADLQMMHEGPKVDLLFRDAANRVWRRRANGVLERRTTSYTWNTEYNDALQELPPIPLIETPEPQMDEND